MDRKGPFRFAPFFISSIIIIFAILIPSEASQGTCRTGCKGASDTFKYAIGTTYKYNYDGKIEISLSSAEGQTTSTEVKATVLLTQLADCNQLIRLQNVQVLGSNGKKLGTIPDVEKPIQINFHNGHIEDSICTEPSDTQNSLNIKRSIASIFQINLSDGYETDVFGLCPTEVSQHHDTGSNVLLIEKNRNLNKCNYRENIKQDFFHTAFDLNSEFKTSPILNGDFTSKTRIKNGILEQSTITENYLYVPFSNGKNGAKAVINTKLTLAGQIKENPKSNCNKPRSIIFENPHVVESPTSNVNVILNAVKEVVKTIDVVVGEQTAKEFITLIRKVRVAKKDDLLAVYNQVKSGVGFADKNAAKKLFLEAVLRAGTGEGAEMAITLLKNREFNEIESKIVFIGLSMVKHATEPSLITAASLLDQKNLPFEAYLGVGNLAGKFCQQHDCNNNDAVNKLTQKLIQKLNDGKTTNKNIENESIYVLKALRNFQHLNDNILQKIISIASNKQASNRLRAVALETYLADPCKDKLRNSALGILQDLQQDSEIRIKAYLVLAQCPNAKIGNAVKSLIEKEPSYQVGGFIVSHIRSLKASANSDKNLAKQYLAFSVPKRFPIDFRKWSYNSEFSYAIDSLGLASSAETNTIYSQDSFLPRSTSLNLTAEVFGHKLNFLEIQSRQEGLDKLVEHYFGPRGVFKRSSLGEMLKNNEQVAGKIYKHFEEKVEETLRSKRDVSKSEIDQIQKTIQIKENSLNKDFDLDLSIKSCSSELYFNSFNLLTTPEEIIDDIVDRFGKGLDKLKNFKENLRSNLPLLDLELNYPTSVGFPLKIAAEGVASVQIEAEGSIDVRQLIKEQDTSLRLKLIPSANVEISARLTLDALVAENGLKVISTLHTATGGDITINLYDHLRGLDVKFGLPVKDQTLISANHEIVFHTRDQSGHEVNQPLKFAQAKDFSICIDHLSPFIGLSFCGEINGPNLAGSNIPKLPFPLSGDAKLAITIENEDVKEYHLKRVFNPHLTSLQFQLETIGKNNRPKVDFNLNAEYDKEKFIKATFNSELKNAYAELRLTDNEHEKSLLAKAGFDKSEFFGKIGVSIQASGGRSTYKPILDIRTPGNVQDLPLKVQGQVIAEKKDGANKFIFDHIKLDLPNGKQLGVNGNFGNDHDDFYVDLTVNQDKQSGSFKGRSHYEKHLLKFNGEFTNNVNPQVNFNIKGEVKHKNEEYETNVQLIHGSDLSSKTNKLLLTVGTVRYYKNPQDYKIGFKNKINYPLVGIDTKIEFEQTARTFEYDVDIIYGEIKFGSELSLEIKKKHSGDYDIDFEIHGLENKVEFKSERQVHGDESQINNELVLNGKKLEVKGKIKHSLKPSNVDVGAVLTVVLPSHNTPFKVNSGLRYDNVEIDAHHKVTSGNVVIIDAFIKANQKLDANGKVNVNIKDILLVNGALKSVKGTGNVDLLIDVQKLKKQVKFDGNFKIQPGSLYNIHLDLYPSYSKDKSQKITISTKNNLKPNQIDSKTSLDILTKKLDLNIVASKAADSTKGEIELILPNSQYFLAKLHEDHKIDKNELYNGEGSISFEYRKNKNTPGKKASLKTKYTNTNADKGLFDVVYNLSLDDSNGNTINADVQVKKTKNNENRNNEIKTKLYGSVFEKNQPITGDFTFNYGPESVLVQAEGTLSTKNRLKLKASYSGENNADGGDLDLEVATASEKLKKLKVGMGLSLISPKTSSDKFEVKYSGVIFVDGEYPKPIIDFKGDGYVRATDKDGEVKSNINSDKTGPISIKLGYSQNESDKQKEYKSNVALEYGKNKNIKADIILQKSVDDRRYKFESQIVTPFDKYKNTHLTVNTERSEDDKHIKSNLKLNVDENNYNVDTELKLSDIAPLIDIKVKYPDGKKSELYWKAMKSSNNNEISVEFKFQCGITNYLFEGNYDANLDLDNFHVKSNLNSPNLNINKYLIDIQLKHAKTGSRRLQITIKSAGKNIVSGSTTYNAKEEQGKYIVEGSGTLKVKEESKSANFKYISQKLHKEEQGTDISFNGAIGDKAIDAELKITNRHFRVLESYCEKNKECAHIELDSKLTFTDDNNYNHLLEIVIDLKKLGVSSEFGLKSVTKREELKFEHIAEVHLDNRQYQNKIHLTPKDFIWHLTTPQRLIALESKLEYPKDVKLGGKFAGELSLFLDKKNQPNKKASIDTWLNLDVKNHNLNGEMRFIHPGLPRPLSVSVRSARTGDENGQLTVNAELDIFTKQSQKLIGSYVFTYNLKNSLKSAKDVLIIKNAEQRLNIELEWGYSLDTAAYSGEYTNRIKYKLGDSNYDNVLSLKGGKDQVNFLLRVLNNDLLKILNKILLTKEQQIIDSEISSYDNNPLVSHLEIKNLNTLLYTITFKKDSKNKLQFNAGFIPGQIADIRSDRIKPEGKINLFHASLKLDTPNFLKPNYDINSKEIQQVLSEAKEKFAKHIEGVNNVQKTWGDELKNEMGRLNELSKKSSIDLTPIKNYYAEETEKIKNEFLTDKTVREIVDTLKQIFGTIAETVAHIYVTLVDLIVSINDSVQTAIAGIVETLQNELLPSLKRVAEKLTGAITDITKTILDIFAGYLATVSEIIEKYQPEIKQFAAIFGELGQDVGRFIQKTYQQIREIFQEFFGKLYEELKALPIFDELRAQYEQFVADNLPGKEGIIAGAKEIAATIKDFVPEQFFVHDELIQIIDLTIDYLEKKLTEQPVDDLAVFEKVGSIHVGIIKKCIAMLSSQNQDLNYRGDGMSISWDFFKKLPKIVAIKFSPIAYLLKEDPSEAIFVFLLSLMNDPQQWFAPFPIQAMVIQGQHIFTFDEKYINLPQQATCKYLLAADAVNGNFTLIGTYNNGQLVSITLADKHDSLTLKNNGQVLLNNAATELPARKPEIAAYVVNLIHLESTTGVKVNCLPDLAGCSVDISGYYHGQIKGLMGNGNNEPYDDFTAANGKISADLSEFVNSYKVGNCKAVIVPKIDGLQKNEVCSKLFGWESSLRYCFPFVKTGNFETACVLGEKHGLKNTEVHIAQAYVQACRHHNIPINMPQHLLQCTNSDKPYHVGEKFSVKLPQKSADIVLVVDTVKTNENIYKELFQPLVQDLVKILQSKGISDVQFHLISYGGENHWPSHVTVSGKLTFKGKAPNLKFSDTKDELVIPEGGILQKFKPHIESLHEALHDIKLAFGQDLQAQTFSEAFFYPFRANAVKSIVVLNSRTCEVGNLFALQKLRTLLYKNNQITINLITPFESLSVKDSKKSKDVIGFNDEHVFTLSQAKKKPEGSAELYKDLRYEDYCVDFTIRNRGNVYVTNNFVSAKGDGKKQFIHVAAHNIVEELTKVEEGLNCECVQVTPYAAHNLCVEAYAKET